MQQHTDSTINALREGRMQFGYSYKLASGLIKLPTPQLLAKWEHGETTPSLKYLMRLMVLYHMNPVTMFPRLYKEAHDLVMLQKEKLGVTDRQQLFVTQANYTDYLNMGISKKTDL